MFEIVTKLLLHKQLTFEKGRINLFGRPSSLLPTDSFVNIQKELAKMDKENIIYIAGKKSGRGWFEEMSRAYKLKGHDVVEWGSNIVTLAGWGEAVIKKRDTEKKIIVFNLNNSTVVDLYGKSEGAVDHLFRGLLCGAMCFIFKAELEAVESKCRAKGDSECEFIVQPKDNFDFNNPLIKKQLKDV